MRIAIVGFPGSGKSTCFKAITQKPRSETETLDPTKAHIGTVKILDPRMEKLRTLFNPEKLTFAEIVLEDLPGFHIPQIKEVEALMEVLGIFSGRDAVKDIENMDLEFALADLEIISRRLPALEKELKQAKTKEKTLEQEVLLRCKGFLEGNRPLRELELAPAEEKSIRGFQFLSRKPLFILGNIDEGRSCHDAVGKLEEYCGRKRLKCAEFCAKLEAEIADLEESEKEAFLKEMGIGQTARDRIIALAYSALGYITFFTVKGGETKAWPLKAGTTAIEAAGKIHSDIQKGFIKAEVVNFGDLVSSGSVAEARKRALLRLEGKEYKIRDGDIIDFRFSI